MVGFSKSIAALASKSTGSSRNPSKISKNDSTQQGLGRIKKKRKQTVTVEKKKSKKRKNAL